MKAQHDPDIALSVVIPAHNCEALIQETVARLTDRIGKDGAEILVVENGSSDDTLRRCQQMADEWDHQNVSLVVLQSEKGMGNALRTGILDSRGASVLLTADDLPFGFDDLDAADRIAATNSGRLPPVLIGSKAHPDSQVRRHATRGALTSGFGLMRRLLLGSRVGDSQGTFLVEGRLLRGLAASLREPGFLFTTELVHAVERAGIQPVEVPVTLRADHREHPSRISLADVAAMGLGLLRLRWRHRADRRTHGVNAEWPSPR